jgi:hypothetical protein
MKASFVAATCLAVMASGGLPSPVLAQQRIAKAYQDEWRAGKADHRAIGITQRAHVAQCRGEHVGVLDCDGIAGRCNFRGAPR